jgi:hypothetical protein
LKKVVKNPIKDEKLLVNVTSEELLGDKVSIKYKYASVKTLVT